MAGNYFRKLVCKSLTQGERPLVRGHWSQLPSDLSKKDQVQPWFDDREQRFPMVTTDRSFRMVSTEPLGNLPTYSSFDGTALPSYISQVKFPAGDVAGYKAPRGRTQSERTEEDRRNAEAVLTTPIRLLEPYITPEMIDVIKDSPYFKRHENEVVFSSHRYRTRGQNVQHCYKMLSHFIRNASREISYRTERIAVDEMMYREDGSADDPE